MTEPISVTQPSAHKQKKLMLLGGLRYLLPVIEAAHRLGIYVITCDYLPDNIAHKYSDEFHNISILDKEAILCKAQELQIDGIMSFAVDPGVITAAYVQDKMGLPAFGPYESVCILQNKDRFRKFLQDHGFNCPWAYSFATYEEAMEASSNFTWPAIVKPTDSAGSKGVTKVNSADELSAAIKHAFNFSFSKNIIIEEFIEKAGCSSDTDCFAVNGELKFVSFSAQRFDLLSPNPYTPAGYSWPSTMTAKQEAELTSEIQRLITLLHMQSTIYNIESRVGTDGKTYIMEVTPRGGGNRLAEVLHYATGVDLVGNAVRAAVGLPPDQMEQRPYQGHWIELILHTRNNGTFDAIEIADAYKDKVVETDLWVSPGDTVHAFHAANDAIGTLILKLDSNEEVEKSHSHPDEVYKIKLR